METEKKILIIDFCNYDDYPTGGYLTFAKNLTYAFGETIALVGITTQKEDPVGQWFKKNIKGISYNFFALSRYNKSVTKHILPDRLVMYLLLKYYKKKILSASYANVFIQRPEIVIATRNFAFKNICFCFAGLENPLSISKYWFAKRLASFFDKLFFSSIKNIKLFLAAGDNSAIKNMIVRSKGKIDESLISQFPTRIDTTIFKSLERNKIRHSLKIKAGTTVITTTGRLSSLKGWKFMINSFSEFEKNNPNKNCLFYFIGDGEDFEKINKYIGQDGLSNRIILLGRKTAEEIAFYLNASDLYVMGSYKEGWSTTLIEALACGVPICTTDFSSAKDIVTEKITGYVCKNHDVATFSKKMGYALAINREKLPLSSEIKKFALSELKSDLLREWHLF